MSALHGTYICMLIIYCSIAYALKAASFLKGDLKKYHDLIEDVIAQSDEVDDKYAQVGT